MTISVSTAVKIFIVAVIVVVALVVLIPVTTTPSGDEDSPKETTEATKKAEEAFTCGDSEALKAIEDMIEKCLDDEERAKLFSVYPDGSTEEPSKEPEVEEPTVPTSVPDWGITVRKITPEERGSWRPGRHQPQGSPTERLFRKAFQRPTKTSRYQPQFTGDLQHPLPEGTYRYIRGVGNGHYGVDLAAPTGTPVSAVADGYVVESRYSTSFGHTILVDHGKGFKTRYAHHQRNLVRTGSNVKQGQVIAYVGSTGRSDGSHLHLETHGIWNPWSK